LERIKRTKEMLSYPVLEFVDLVLECVSESYWTYMDTGNVAFDVSRIQKKDSLAEARVLAIDNNDIHKNFKDFTTRLYTYRQSMNKKADKYPDDEKKNLEESASLLLKKLIEIRL